MKNITAKIKSCLEILSESDRRKILWVTIFQTFTSLLDLVGVAAIGILGAITIAGVEQKAPGDRVMAVLTFLNLENLTLQQQSAVVGVAAAVLMVSKTIFSVIFLRRTLRFLSVIGARFSQDLVHRLFKTPLLNIQVRSRQELIHSTTWGANALTVGVIGTLTTLATDFTLMLIMFIGLLFVDWQLAIATLALFSAVAFTLFFIMNTTAKRLGKLQTAVSVTSNEILSQGLENYRELFVRNKISRFVQEFGKSRNQLSEINSKLTFLPYVSKYVLEITIVVGFLLISAFEFIRHDVTHAAAVVSIFLASSSRIGPAIMRIQQGVVSIRVNLSAGEETLILRNELIKVTRTGSEDLPGIVEPKTFVPCIEIENISFTYPGDELSTLFDISIKANAGEMIAIVGASGAGKSTLIDLLLGIHTPNAGEVRISGEMPKSAISHWPGYIGYVPQESVIIQGSIRDNVLLGFNEFDYSDAQIWESLRKANLDHFVAGLPLGLNTLVGDSGARLSGGQRQRLGIARALITNPKLIVLDEATSALDSESEKSISDSLLNLRGSATIVLIAHRLSTVRKANQVIYLGNGKVVSNGTFEHVRKSVPDFDKQASLMGL